MSAPDRKHLFGILELNGDAPPEPIALGDYEGDLQMVGHRDIAAAVGRTPLADYRALDKETLLRCLVAHQRVLEHLLARATVIPVKFGTLAAGDGEVERILQVGYADLKRALAESRGKTEFEVVGTWQVAQVLSEISVEPEIRQLKAQVEALPAEARRQGQIEAGKAVKQRLDQRKREVQEALRAELSAGLAGCGCRLRLNETMDDGMVLNLAVLVPLAQQQGFEAALGALDESYAGRLSFRCIGPLPPYSFATVEIRRADSDDVTRARATLGLGEEASLGQVQQAYHGLAAACHPDRCPGDPGAVERFRDITAAWQTITAYCANGDDAERVYSLRGEQVERAVRVAIVEGGRDPIEPASVVTG